MSNRRKSRKAKKTQPPLENPFLKIKVIKCISKFLTAGERISCRTVCKQWMQVLDDPALWKYCNFIINPKKLTEFLKFLSKLKSIECLQIEAKLSPSEKAANSFIIENEALVANSEQNELFNDIILELKELQCFRSFINFEVSSLPNNLRHFFMSSELGLNGGDDLMLPIVIQKCPDIVSYHYHCCTINQDLNELFIEFFEDNLDTLEQLTFACEGLDDSVFYRLGRCSKLTSLRLINCNFADINLWKMFAFKFLSTLYISSHNPTSSSNILIFLKKMVDVGVLFKHVKYLGINMNKEVLTEYIFALIHMGFPNLKTFCLDETEFRNECILPFLNYHETIENLIIRHSASSLTISSFMSIVYTNLIKPLRVCLCNAEKFDLNRIEFKDQNNAVVILLESKKAIPLACEICHLYYDPFLCGCF